MMKSRISVSAWAILLLLVFTLTASADDTGPPQAPQAFLPQNIWEFDTVVEGSEIVHEFAIQNKGTRDLDIARVRTS
jgi:hypothetical protein